MNSNLPVQDLDKNGDGRISCEELEFALIQVYKFQNNLMIIFYQKNLMFILLEL